MAEWEIHPFESMGDNSPQTQLKQIEQEFASIARKLEFLIAEKSRLLEEIEKKGVEQI